MITNDQPQQQQGEEKDTSCSSLPRKTDNSSNDEKNNVHNDNDNNNKNNNNNNQDTRNGHQKDSDSHQPAVCKNNRNQPKVPSDCDDIQTSKTAIVLTLLRHMKTISNLAIVKELSFMLNSPSRNAPKASPFVLKSWIALALTLDGRDKITKLLQYTCRMMAHYYERMMCTISSTGTSNGIGRSNNNDVVLQMEYLSSRIKSFRNLQNSLANSRKAYRLGRSIIELDKLQSIGLGRWVKWQWMTMMNRIAHHHHYGGGGGGPFLVSSSRDGAASTAEVEATKTKPKTTATKTTTTVSAPPRMHLPRKISSNIGGPTAIVSSSSLSTKTTNAMVPRNNHNNDDNDDDIVADRDTFSASTLTRYRQGLSFHMVKFLYLSFSTGMDYSYNQQQQEMKEHPPSLWNVCLSATKLLGLAGFWAADNLSYLYSSGFWNVAVNGKESHQGGGGKQRARDASIVAARCYFVAALSGLLLNLKEFVKFRNGPLREALDDWNYVMSCRDSLTSDQRDKNMNGVENVDTGSDNGDGEHLAFRKHEHEIKLDRLKDHLETVKQKYVAISISLLKVRF